MLRCLAALSFSTSMMVGCVALDAPATSTPAITVSPQPEVALAAVNASRDQPVPQPETCRLELDGDEERCPDEILASAALSWLGKTVAEFDGTRMVTVEHDPELLMEEAHADPEFCRILHQADTRPADGRIDRDEALHVEARVLEAIEARYAVARL